MRWRLSQSREAFIKVLDVDRVIDIFHKLAARTTGAVAKRALNFSALGLSLSPRPSHPCFPHTTSPAQLQFDPLYGFLSQLNWRVQWIEPPGETSLTSGCGDFKDLHDASTAHAALPQVIYAHVTE